MILSRLNAMSTLLHLTWLHIFRSIVAVTIWWWYSQIPLLPGIYHAVDNFSHIFQNISLTNSVLSSLKIQWSAPKIPIQGLISIFIESFFKL